MHKLFRQALPLLVVVAGFAWFAPALRAQAEHAVLQGYQKAPQPIHDILNGPPTPLVLVSPKADQLLVVDRMPYPPIADMAQPMLRLAGLRINPATNGRHHPARLTAISVVDIATGKTRKVTGLPVNAHLGTPEWSPDGKQFAFTNTNANSIELWLGNSSSAAANRVEGMQVNSVMGEPAGPALPGQTVP